MNKQIIITGNIGTGKSTVTYMFEQNGYKIISADLISSDVLEQYQNNISKIFSIHDQDFNSFKKELGTLVFKNILIKKELEDFMLPFIQEEIERLAVKYTNIEQKYIIEAPTYFEVNGLQNFSNKFIILIQADEDIRIQRILQRNKHLSVTDIQNRMNSQINPIDKVPFCNEIIWNNKDRETLKSNVQVLIDKIKDF